MMLDTLITIILVAAAFAAGMKIDNYYHIKAAQDTKDALQKQFLRLRARADADDPCKPYGTPQLHRPIPIFNQGDPDGDGPINEAFMNELHTVGHAKRAFRKSDLAK